VAAAIRKFLGQGNIKNQGTTSSTCTNVAREEIVNV